MRFVSVMCVLAGLVSLAAGCPKRLDPAMGNVAAEERDGVWVFRYTEPPTSWMLALGHGRARVADGCLWMGDRVVVWRDEHLGAVDDVIARVRAGEALDLRVGGGGISLDEGATPDRFPAAVNERCPAAAVWFAARSELTIETAVAAP